MAPGAWDGSRLDPASIVISTPPSRPRRAHWAHSYLFAGLPACLTRYGDPGRLRSLTPPPGRVMSASRRCHYSRYLMAAMTRRLSVSDGVRPSLATLFETFLSTKFR